MATTENHNLHDLDAKTDVGHGTAHAAAQHGVETGEFDREIGLKGILWSGAVLVAIALVTHFLIWGLLRGFDKMDDRRDVQLSPIESASPQPAEFPEPRLQTDQELDLKTVRDEENNRLQHAGWVNQPQGVMRVPVDVAIDVIAKRGVAPLAAPQAAATPATTPAAPQASAPGTPVPAAPPAGAPQH